MYMICICKYVFSNIWDICNSWKIYSSFLPPPALRKISRRRRCRSASSVQKSRLQSPNDPWVTGKTHILAKRKFSEHFGTSTFWNMKIQWNEMIKWYNMFNFGTSKFHFIILFMELATFLVKRQNEQTRHKFLLSRSGVDWTDGLTFGFRW